MKTRALAGFARLLRVIGFFASLSAASADGPVFTTQPRSRVVAEGTHLYLNAYAEGTLDFDWYRGAEKLPHQNAYFYSIAAITLEQAGGYYQVACNASGCSTSTVAEITVVPADALSQWQRTWPAGVTTPLGLAAFGNGQYLVAAYDSGNGDALVSEDGVSWRDAGLDSGSYYGGLVFAEGQFVLAGGEDNGPAVLLTSTNGRDWKRLLSDHQWDVFWNLNYQDGVFAMIASEEDSMPGLLRSTDGAHWTQIPQALSYLTVSHGVWLGISRPAWPGYQVAISTNALQWTNLPAIGLQEDYLLGLAAGPDKFLAFGSYFIKWSEDGVTWMDAILPESPANPGFIFSIAHGTNGYVALLRGFCEPTLCFYSGVHTLHSRDGIHWEIRRFPVETALSRMNFAGDLYIATGEQGAIFTSPDGLTWTQRAGASTRSLHALAGNRTGAVAVGARGVILRSSDGASWTRHDGVTGDDLFAINLQNGRYVAAGGASYSVIAESSNGQDWSIWTDPAGGSLRGIAGNGSQFVAVGLRGTVVKSGSSSRARYTVSGAPDFRGVALLNGRYVAIAYPEPAGYPPPPTPGAIYTSEDGEDEWTLRATNQLAFYAIASGNGRAVVAGASGTVLTSTDGVTWIASDIGVNEHILSLDFAAGMFVAGARDGNIFSSKNGADWVGHDLGIQPYYYAQPTIRWIGHAFGRVFAGGAAEEIWRSALMGPRLKAERADKNSGGLHCTIVGLEGSTFRIQHSTDLISWSDWGNYTSPAEIQFLLPCDTDQPRRFFRAIEP